MTTIDNTSNRINTAALESPSSAPSTSAPSTDAPVLMPDATAQLECSGDPGAMLAALSMKMAKQQHETARAQRDQAMQAQEKADAAQIQDIRDKANLQRIQGVVDGTMQMAQGACDLGSGLNSIAGAGSTGDAKASSDKAAAWDKFGGSAFGAARSVADGFFSGAITDKDADAKKHEASASTFKQMADDAHDAEHDAKDLLNKSLDFYKEYVDTKNQTAMAAIHRA